MILLYRYNFIYLLGKTKMNKFTFDLCNMALIIMGIQKMYKKRYSISANQYMSNQLNIILASSTCCMIILYIYNLIEKRLCLNSLWFDDICLTVLFLIGGILTNNLFKYFFHCSRSQYIPSDEEYLFLVIISFTSVSIKMIFYGMLNSIIPFTIILGRLVWLDTKNLNSIINEIKVQHMRIIETSILFLSGTLIVSLSMYYFNLSFFYGIWLTFGYILIILYPYNFLIKIFITNKGVNQ